MEEYIKYKKVLSIIAGVMLLLAIPSIWPYGYFIFLRWIVTGAAGLNAYAAHHFDRSVWFWIMLIVAILFNPIAPIHLTKEIWVVIDLIIAILMFVSIKKIHGKK